MAEGEAEAVLASVLAAAKGGDMGAARVLLDRVWPVRRGRPVRHLLRYVFFHSIALLVLVGLAVMLQAYVYPFTLLVP